MFEKSFSIKATNNNNLTINTPDCFNIFEYLDFCFSYDVDKHAEKRDNNGNVISHTNDRHHKVVKYIFDRIEPLTEGEPS